MLLALLYLVFRLLLEALVDRRHPDADLRLELLVLRRQLGLLERQASQPVFGTRADYEPTCMAPGRSPEGDSAG